MTKRMLEVLAMLMIGDGVLSLLQPKRHCLIWLVGPKAWRDLLDEFVEHPQLTRAVGATQATLGVALAARLQPRWVERARGL